MKTEMIFFDCDGVLIDGDLWVNLHERINFSKEIDRKWFNDYYLGKISYEDWLSKLSSIYTKSLTKTIFEEVMSNFTIHEDAREITSYLNSKHMKMAIISSGADFYVKKIANHLNIPIWRSNSNMKYDEEGKFIEFEPSIEDPLAKVAQIKQICSDFDIDPTHTFFVGDSYNDLNSFAFTQHGMLYRNKEERCVSKAWKVIDNLMEIVPFIET